MKIDDFFRNINSLSFRELFSNIIKMEEPLLKLNTYIEEKTNNKMINNSVIEGNPFLKGNYIIGNNTIIGNNVTILGPVIIGDNVTIMPGALIRPYTILGDDVVVGHGAEIKHSIIMNKAKVQSFTFVGDSIIGYKTRIGSGTILANRRFDQKNVLLKYKGNKIDLQTDFFGSVIGDNTRLGANSICYPGTFIGRSTWVYPGTEIRGYIESLKRISNHKEIYITDNSEYELKN